MALTQSQNCNQLLLHGEKMECTKIAPEDIINLEINISERPCNISTKTNEEKNAQTNRIY